MFFQVSELDGSLGEVKEIVFLRIRPSLRQKFYIRQRYCCMPSSLVTQSVVVQTIGGGMGGSPMSLRSAHYRGIVVVASEEDYVFPVDVMCPCNGFALYSALVAVDQDRR